jgi:hypothetical protein
MVNERKFARGILPCYTEWFKSDKYQTNTWGGHAGTHACGWWGAPGHGAAQICQLLKS